MKRNLAMLAALCAICFGCATPPEPQATGASSATATATPVTYTPSARRRPTITGSRLAPLDDDDVGTNSVSGVTGDEYRHEADTRVCSGSRTTQPGLCNSF